jgi:hypothetical protein
MNLAPYCSSHGFQELKNCVQKEKRMKNKVFGKCEKCIGITPCRILDDGRIVCEYCTNEVKHFIIKTTEKIAPGTSSRSALAIE